MKDFTWDDDALPEAVIPWVELSEHDKDQIRLVAKGLTAWGILAVAVTVFNVIVWKRK